MLQRASWKKMKNATDYGGGDKSYKSRLNFCNDDENEEQE